MKYSILTRALALLFLAAAPAALAQTPALLNYQGRVQTGTPPVDFNGTGEFKFSLIRGSDNEVLWNSAGATVGEPQGFESVPVTNGLYSVMLGDASMNPIGPMVFASPDVRLRVWFNGQQLSPDQRLATNGYLPSHIPGPIAIGNTAAPDFPITLKVNGTSDLMGFRNSTDGTKWHLKLATGSNVLNFVESGVAENRLVLAPGGNIGIGTSSPTKGKLHIEGTVPSTAVGTHGSLLPGGASGNNTGGNILTPSVYASGKIIAQEFIAFSDARIKHTTGLSDAARDLDTLNRIQITNYTYRDTVARGTAPQKKVIAQQVETVFPQAVSRATDVVPDIYKKATPAGAWVELKTDLKVGERVRLIAEKAEGIHEVLEVREGAFRTAFTPESKEIFVYGREVNDFRTVDYEAIAMLNVSATQELARQLESEKATTTALKERLAKLEAKDAARDAKLAALMKLMEDRGGEAEAATVSTVTTRK